MKGIGGMCKERVKLTRGKINCEGLEEFAYEEMDNKLYGFGKSGKI